MSHKPIFALATSACLTALSALPQIGGAALIPIATNSNANCRVDGTFLWTFQPPEAAAIPPPAGPWKVNVNTLPGQQVTRASVEVKIQHTTGVPACDPGHGPNAASITFPAAQNIIERPAGKGGAIKAGAKQLSHDAHNDIGSFAVAVTGQAVPPGNVPAALALLGAPVSPLVAAQIVQLGAVGQIQAKGLHTAEQLDVRPSFKNTLGKSVQVRIAPDYRLTADSKGLNKKKDEIVTLPARAPVEVKAGEDKKDFLPFERKITSVRVNNKDIPASGTLASLTYTASGSATTTTTLAFVGEVDGVLSELDFDTALLHFLGTEEFFVPMLRNEGIDLFVAVDMVQWLSFMRPIVPNKPYTVDSFGFIEDLPGFLVSTTEIGFGANGFETNSPFSGGQVFVASVLDGQVPEPGALVLLAIGMAGIGWAQRRRICRAARRAAPLSLGSR